jgi:hypothetical protein
MKLQAINRINQLKVNRFMAAECKYDAIADQYGQEGATHFKTYMEASELFNELPASEKKNVSDKIGVTYACK